MPKRITYRQLENILLNAGFHRSRTKGSHIIYFHDESNARIVLPPPKLRSVPDVYVRAIGKTVDEYGIMPREEFFRMILEKELD